MTSLTLAAAVAVVAAAANLVSRNANKLLLGADKSTDPEEWRTDANATSNFRGGASAYYR